MSRIRFLFRQDSAGAWTSNNPTLAAGEIGVELDSAGGVSPKFKIGNGILAWNDSSFNYFINDSDQAGLAGGAAGGGTAALYGDRGIVAGGENHASIDYFDITTPGNASDFGDITSVNTHGSCSNAIYALFAGGAPDINDINYVTISTLANASYYGDLTVGRYALSGCGDGTYGLFCGGRLGTSYKNELDYVTVATPGNASDFGNLTANRGYLSSVANSTYGVIGGGYDTGRSNVIEYVTMASPGNASDFGDLTEGRNDLTAVQSETRAVFCTGRTVTVTSTNIMDYVTIDTPGNATDFGDAAVSRFFTPAGVSNGTTGCIAGGYGASNLNDIDYFSIATTGNASDFGDLTAATRLVAGCSGSPS